MTKIARIFLRSLCKGKISDCTFVQRERRALFASSRVVVSSDVCVFFSSLFLFRDLPAPWGLPLNAFGSRLNRCRAISGLPLLCGISALGRRWPPVVASDRDGLFSARIIFRQFCFVFSHTRTAAFRWLLSLVPNLTSPLELP